ncbi:MAG: DUF427 domain-containing protein [Pseudomonadota bacterium]
MIQATLNGTTIAESDATIVIEGNHYFPPTSIDWDSLEPSDTQSRCPWKGLASYYHIVVDGERSTDAAWTYPEPSEAAKEIKEYVAFWNGVHVEELG